MKNIDLDGNHTVITNDIRCVCKAPTPYRSYSRVTGTYIKKDYGIPVDRCLDCTNVVIFKVKSVYVHCGSLEDLIRKSEELNKGNF